MSELDFNTADIKQFVEDLEVAMDKMRANEPASGSPKQSVVQQAATDGACSKILDVQQSADIFKQIEAVIVTVYNGYERELWLKDDVYDRSLAVKAMLAVVECLGAVRELFKQQAQSEAVDGERAAADC